MLITDIHNRNQYKNAMWTNAITLKNDMVAPSDFAPNKIGHSSLPITHSAKFSTPVIFWTLFGADKNVAKFAVYDDTMIT